MRTSDIGWGVFLAHPTPPRPPAPPSRPAPAPPTTSRCCSCFFFFSRLLAGARAGPGAEPLPLLRRPGLQQARRHRLRMLRRVGDQRSPTTKWRHAKIEAPLECARVACHVSCTFWRRLACSAGALVAKLLHRSSGGSLLRACCWLGMEKERERDQVWQIREIFFFFFFLSQKIWETSRPQLCCGLGGPGQGALSPSSGGGGGRDEDEEEEEGEAPHVPQPLPDGRQGKRDLPSIPDRV